MPLPRDVGQLTLALLFRPGAVDTAGLRIAIAAHMPDRYQMPTTFLTATLCDVSPETHRGFPIYRFIIDEASHDSEAVQRVLTSSREGLERTYQTYDDGDTVKELVRQEMGKPPLIWLKFASSDWIAALGDRVTIDSVYGDPEPIGDISQLTVLK